MPAGAEKKHDRDKIFNDFVQWARDTPDALTVPQYATSIGIHSGMMWNWAAENDLHRELLNIGKEIIGINRLKHTLVSKDEEGKRLERGIYLATIKNYDVDYKLHDRDERKFDSDLRKQEEGEKKQPIVNIVDYSKANNVNNPSS